jgi:phosphoglycolate phosphatase-like HAD superfamily hydrolase
MIGDILNDVEAGRAAGCRTILLTNGNETEWNLTASRWPDFIADEMFEAARLISSTDLPAIGGRALFETRRIEGR